MTRESMTHELKSVMEWTKTTTTLEVLTAQVYRLAQVQLEHISEPDGEAR